MAVFENSRYLQSDLVMREERENVSVLGFRQRHNFNEASGTQYEWVLGDTLDGLAKETYGANALRWAILDANPQYRSEFDIQPGDMILLPDFDEVVNLVNVESEEDDE